MSTHMSQKKIIEQGSKLMSGGQFFTISDLRDPNRVILALEGQNEFRTISMDHLLNSIGVSVHIISNNTKSDASELIIRNPADAYIEKIPIFMRSAAVVSKFTSQVRWIDWLKRKGFQSLRPSNELEIAIRELEQEYQEICPFSIHTLYKADRKIKKNGNDKMAIVPNFHLRGGAGINRLDDFVEQAINEVLSKAAFPEWGKIKPSKIHNEVKGRISQIRHAPEAKHIKDPSLHTIARRMRSHFSEYEIAIRNEGKKRADKIFRNDGARVTAARALDIVEFDDIDTGVFLVDSNGLPWGRAFLTTGIDQATDAPVGMSIGPEYRSQASAIDAFIHATFPKDHNSDIAINCNGQWEYYGHIGAAILDNATYNSARGFEAVLLEMGTEVIYSKPKTPTNKQAIEGFQGRIKLDFFSDEEGWAPKEDREQIDRGMANAICDIRVFSQRVYRYLVDNYSNMPGIDGLTAHQRWRSEFKYGPPLIPKYSPSQELIGTIYVSGGLKFRDSGGLLRLQLRYQSPELSDLRRKIGKKASVEVRYKPNNLSYLYVKNPITQAYLRVPCIEDPRYYKGLTDYQQRLIIKHARNLKGSNPSYKQMYEARQDLAKETKDLSRSKKMRDRKRAIMIPKSVDTDGQKPSNFKTEFVDYKCTDLEERIRELNDLPFSVDEEINYGLL